MPQPAIADLNPLNIFATPSSQGLASLYHPPLTFESQDSISNPLAVLAFQNSISGQDSHTASPSIPFGADLNSELLHPDTSLNPNTPVRFDSLTGILSIQGDSRDNILHESTSKRGYFELNLDGLLFSSDANSAHYTQALAGATRDSVKALNFEGGLGHDKLILDRQALNQTLSVTADDEVNITGNISSKGDVNITAAEIKLNAKLQANSIFFNAASVLNQGEIKTKGSTTINFTDKYTDSVRSSISGKKIGISGGTTGSLEASGKFVAKEIALLGKQVSLLGANIDASGKNGGGTVLIGGDYQGKGIERGIVNATNTVVDKNTVILADALTKGNGGKVFIWSDEETIFKGSVSVKGGSKSGNGGFVEVSGKHQLKFAGQVDTSAPNGKFGTLLIDPENIYIGADDGDPDTYDVSDLAKQTGNVILSATNNITIEELDFVESTGTITIQADSDRDGVGTVTVNPNVGQTGTVSTGSRNIDISGVIVNLGNLGSGSGNITVTAANSITASQFVATSGGNITVTAKNSITVNGHLDSDNNNGNGGTITLKSTMGNIFASSISAYSQNANAGKIDVRAKTGIQISGIASMPFSNGVGYSQSSPLGSVFMSADDFIDIGALSLGKSVDAHLISRNSNISIGLTAIALSNGVASNLRLDAKLGIQTGSINSSAQFDGFANVNGNAGNVGMRAGGDIEAEAIHTNATGTGNGGFIDLQSLEGKIRIAKVERYNNGFYPPSANYLRSDSVGGRGGNITLKAAKTVVVDGAFQKDGTDYSIYSGGATGNGRIWIEREIGPAGNFFAVGDATYNGTKAAISGGLNANGKENILSPTTVVIGDYSKGNIKILTPNGTPPETIPVTPSPSPTPTTYSYTTVTSLEVRNLLNQNKIAEAVVALDNLRTDEFLRSQNNSPRTIPPLTSIGQIQNFLANGDRQAGTSSAVVYTFLDGQELDLITVTATGAPVYEAILNKEIKAILQKPLLTITAKQAIEDAVIDFRSDLRDPDSPDYRNTGKPLYDLLIKPIEADIAQVNNLIFAPDSTFRSIPLAALYNGTQHLCEKFSSSITPSVQVIRSDTYTSLKDADVLKMGATEFIPGGGWRSLPQTLGEMEIIGQLEMASASPTSQNAIYLNQQFNEPNVRKLVQNGNEQIVHFSTHGFESALATESPFGIGQSYLVLGVNNGVKDLLLTASDFRNMKGLDKKELVVFSACQTFINKTKEQFGLAGAALIGGAKSVLGSYWVVSDQGTMALMGGFYQQLLDAGLPKTKALQNIQKAMLLGGANLNKNAGTLEIPNLQSYVTLALPTYTKEKLTDRPNGIGLKHPYYWASFGLSGNPW
ncbi:CHAT domain-containing protein [Tumidithrix elongata RA019]|uniref:CHAT domain-containing protein n=1 Tax=Tumidithrix elongata BACA0141 TaxID=2716417 RepID=A0AAW9Q826_9CYAN|nr:CHAT domain-containing protein [Tumidithrix elongata RA019]